MPQSKRSSDQPSIPTKSHVGSEYQIDRASSEMHSLYDYQSQLLRLDQQNWIRLLMARQEQPPWLQEMQRSQHFAENHEVTLGQQGPSQILWYEALEQLSSHLDAKRQLWEYEYDRLIGVITGLLAGKVLLQSEVPDAVEVGRQALSSKVIHQLEFDLFADCCSKASAESSLVAELAPLSLNSSLVERQEEA